MNKTISTFKFLIGWPLSFLAIIFLIKFAFPKLPIVLKKIYAINYWYLIFSITLFLCYFLLRSYLWKKILEFKGHRVSFWKTAYLWGFSEFKRYVPGNVWSFLSRVSLFSDVGVDKKIAGLALLDEIQLIVVSCTLISIFSLPLMIGSNENAELSSQMKIIIAFCVIGITAYSLSIAYLLKLKGKNNFLNNLFLPGYSLKEKVILMIISVITFFIFGFATLAASLSIFSFKPRLYFELSAFFTFALLAGYLSFITPMGLGVREGVITIGLTRFTTLTTAGFLSIYSRIVLIVSEVTFLCILLISDVLIKNKKK